MVFFQTFDQAGVFFQEIIIPLCARFSPEGDFEGFFFNDPVPFDIPDIKHGDIGMKGKQFLKLEKIIFDGIGFLDGGNIKKTGFVGQHGADRAGQSLLRKKIFDHYAAIIIDKILGEQSLGNKRYSSGHLPDVNELVALTVFFKLQDIRPGLFSRRGNSMIGSDLLEKRGGIHFSNAGAIFQ